MTFQRLFSGARVRVPDGRMGTIEDFHIVSPLARVRIDGGGDLEKFLVGTLQLAKENPMALKKRKVVLEGTEALTITEAKVLIKAAMAGKRCAVMPGDVKNVEIACEKVAEGLIAAGQDRELVEKLLCEW